MLFRLAGRASRALGEIAWHENDGTGVSWELHVLSSAAAGAVSVFAADVDGDGDLDALSAAATGNEVSWHPNLGTLIFADGFDSDGDTSCWSQTVF